MESVSTVVIKVKYGDVLRRFNAQIADKGLNLSIDGLRKKIVSLFGFAQTEMMLTYIDEDNDVVNLVDDDDIRDVVKQGLNPLRITVKLNSGKNGEPYNSSSESSTPLRSPRVQQPIQNLHTSVSEILRTLPEPLRETLTKLTTDIASKASSSAPVLNELIDCFSKLGVSYSGQPSESQPEVQSSMQGGVLRSTDAAETKDSEHSKDVPAAASQTPPVRRSNLPLNNNESLEGLKPGVAMENEGKIPSATRGRRNDSPFDFTAVAAALESQNINVALRSNASLLKPVPMHTKSDVSCSGNKDGFKKIVEMSPLPPAVNNTGKIVESCSPLSNMPSVANKVSTAEVACNPNEPKLGSNHANVGASDLRPGDHVNVKGTPGLSDSVAKSSGSILAPSAMNECPFSGIALGNISNVQPHSSSETIYSRKSISQHDGSQNVVHRGICCDGCDVHPITGPRFKSKVKVDYDLCSTCFEKMGNDTDYIRMDFPVVYPSYIIDGSHEAQARGRGPNLPLVYGSCKVKPVAINLDSCFVEDVNITDGTVMAPLTPFTKIWRMRNNGTVGWLRGTQLVWIGGDKLSSILSVELKVPASGVWKDQEFDVVVDFVAPEIPGRYISYWRMATPSGEKFGQRVWVLIQVDASIIKTSHETIRNLNLNLPPVSTLDGPEVINVEPEPVVKGSHPEPDHSNKIVELVLPETEQDLKFPINDSLLVSNGASSSVPFTASSSSVSYPIVDLSNLSPVLLSVPPLSYPLPPHSKSQTSLATASHSSVDNPLEKNQVAAKLPWELEEKLLKELEEMGFKQADLNKEILRMNEYNMEQAVEDLCGGTDWDSMLDELEEMGFYDREMNKMLLKKNNGSIKRTVMDLIAGEMN